MLESAAKDTNRRMTINLNDGDDNSHFEMLETFKARHMQEEMGRHRTTIPMVPHGYVDHRTRLLRLASLYQRMEYAKDVMIPSILGQWVVFGGLRRARGGSFFLASEIDTILASHFVSLFSLRDPQLWYVACTFASRNTTDKKNLLRVWLIREGGHDPPLERRRLCLRRWPSCRPRE